VDNFGLLVANHNNNLPYEARAYWQFLSGHFKRFLELRNLLSFPIFFCDFAERYVLHMDWS